MTQASTTHEERLERHHLHWAIRHLLVITLGSAVGLLASYTLRYLGM